MCYAHRELLWTEYISVKYDSKGVFRFDVMENAPKFYRNYQAYIIASASNTTVQLHFEGKLCSPIIVEVRVRCARFVETFSISSFNLVVSASIILS